jgi:hypothetical protein
MRLASELKKIDCPKCGKAGALQEIVYGMPSGDFDFEKNIVGGCLVGDDSPDLGCAECGWQGMAMSVGVNRFSGPGEV